MRLDFFGQIKVSKPTALLSAGNKYSMHDKVCDVS